MSFTFRLSAAYWWTLMPDDIEVEDTHEVFDHHGYDPYSTPLDTLMSNEAMGFATAGAMYGDYN